MEYAKVMQALETGKKHHTAELKKKLNATEKARHKQALANIDAKMAQATETHEATPEAKALSAKATIADLQDRVEELETATPADGTDLQNRVKELEKAVAGLQLLMPKQEKK